MSYTTSSRGSSIVGTTGTTWTLADTTHVCDGAVGTTQGTYALWENATPDSTGTITIGYDFSGLNPDAVISSLTATIYHVEYDVAGVLYPKVQLLDNNGDPIGSEQSGTYWWSAHTDTLTLGTPTAAQAIAGLRVKVTGVHSATTWDSIFYLDCVDVTITYTIGPLRVYTDALGASDSHTAVKVGGFDKFYTDPLGLTDPLTQVVSVLRTQRDVVFLTDPVTIDITAEPAPIIIPSAGPGPGLDIEQVVTLHSAAGVTVAEFTGADMTQLSWGRELRDVSTCTLTLPPLLQSTGRLPDIAPWLHWVSVWGASHHEALWTGPIQKISANHARTVISAKDPSVYTARTRVPLTKRWEKVDPSEPAAQMWKELIEAHGLRTPLIVRNDLQGGLFDYSVTADETMVDKAISDLVQLGLRWTVVSGVVILGPAPRQPFAELGENDFIGDTLEVTRDGTSVFNDVLLRGPDNLARARTDLFGLNLQKIVTVDDMYGVSNVEAATTQYARYVSKIRDTVGQPSGAVLHPHAQLSYDQLVPSARVTVSAYGGRYKMELESLTVTINAGRCDVAVKLESVTDIGDLPELAVLSERNTTRNPATEAI